MVDVKEIHNEKKAILTTDKRKESFTLEKDMSGYSSFIFKVSRGKVPEQLAGRYTSIQKGVEAFEAFDRSIKMSQAVKREVIAEERKAQRAELHTENSK